jgi:hypothetical protein
MGIRARRRKHFTLPVAPKRPMRVYVCVLMKRCATPYSPRGSVRVNVETMGGQALPVTAVAVPATGAVGCSPIAGQVDQCAAYRGTSPKGPCVLRAQRVTLCSPALTLETSLWGLPRPNNLDCISSRNRPTTTGAPALPRGALREALPGLHELRLVPAPSAVGPHALRAGAQSPARDAGSLRRPDERRRPG